MPALFSLLLAVFLDLFGLGILRPILPLYLQATFDADVLRVSWIPAAFGVGKLLANIPAGLLMDRLGRSRLMAAGLLSVAAVDILSGLETGFNRFLLWRAAAGFGFGFFVTTAATLVLNAATPGRRGRHMGSYLLVGDAGAMLGAGTSGWIYEQFGPRVPFFAKAALAATAAFIARGTRPPSTARAGARDAGGALRTVVGLPGLLPVSFVNMVLFMADVGVLAVLFPLFLDASGLPPRTIGLFVALTSAAQLVTLAIGSRLADRVGRFPILLAGQMLYSSGLLVLSTAHILEQILPAAILIGTGSGSARAVPAALVGDLAAPHLRGAAMGVFRTLTDIGMIAGPALLGVLAAQAGYALTFLMLAAVLAASTGLLIFIPRISK